MEIEGKCILVLPVESGTSKAGKAWQKRNFIIETSGQYPKKVCLQLFGDKVEKCPNQGDMVKVSFDIDSREYNNRWYTQCNAYAVDVQASAQPAQQTNVLQELGVTGHSKQPTSQSTAPAQQEGDDLPF